MNRETCRCTLSLHFDDSRGIVEGLRGGVPPGMTDTKRGTVVRTKN